MSYNFLSDFLAYNIGTECAPNYLRWSALSTLAVASGRRFILRQGRVEIRPNLYVCLVGDQGTRKSYGKDIARDLISDALPDFPIAADITSRSDIIKFLSSDETKREYKDHNGVMVTWHPLVCFVNELKHFMSYSPADMIAFIVDIYDRKVFKASTLKRGAEDVMGPCLNILACENPDWIINNLKTNIISGGFSRRFVVVFEPDNRSLCIPKPFLPDNHAFLWARMKNHLVQLQSKSGEFIWDEDANVFFDNWYRENWKNLPMDPIIRGFRRTKDQQVLKIVILLSVADSRILETEKPEYRVTVDLLKAAFALFEAIEPNVPKLSIAAGRNELAIPTQKLLDLLENHGGSMTEVLLKKDMHREMSPSEFWSVFKHLEQTEQVKIFDADVLNKTTGITIKRRMVATIEKYNSLPKVKAPSP